MQSVRLFGFIEFIWIHRQKSADFRFTRGALSSQLNSSILSFHDISDISEPRAPSEDRDRRRSRSPPVRDPSPKPDDDLDGLTEKEVCLKGQCN